MEGQSIPVPMNTLLMNMWVVGGNQKSNENEQNKKNYQYGSGCNVKIVYQLVSYCYCNEQCVQSEAHNPSRNVPSVSLYHVVENTGARTALF